MKNQMQRDCLKKHNYKPELDFKSMSHSKEQCLNECIVLPNNHHQAFKETSCAEVSSAFTWHGQRRRNLDQQVAKKQEEVEAPNMDEFCNNQNCPASQIAWDPTKDIQKSLVRAMHTKSHERSSRPSNDRVSDAIPCDRHSCKQHTETFWASVLNSHFSCRCSFEGRQSWSMMAKGRKRDLRRKRKVAKNNQKENLAAISSLTENYLNL